MKGKKKRFFAAGILLFLLLLAVGTMATAADADSYTVTIIKKLELSDDMTPEVREQLLKQEYVFTVTGKKDNQTVVEETVVINDFDKNGVGKAEIDLGVRGEVSTIEQTSHIENIEGWDMSGTSYESHMTVGSGAGEIVLSLDNKDGDNEITIDVPVSNPGTDPETVTFKVSGYDYNNHSQALDLDNGKGYRYVTVKVGGSETLSDLPRGYYTVEQQIAPTGFSLAVKRENVVVSPGEGPDNPAKIKGNSGKITIRRPEGLEENQIQEFQVKKGSSSYASFTLSADKQTYVLDNLPSGDYTITEQVYEGKPGFVVEAPKTTTSTTTKSYTFKEGYLSGYKAPTGNADLGDYVEIKLSNIKGTNMPDPTRVRLKGIWTDRKSVV